MLEVSRRIRNKSVPPPAPSSVSSATLRALSRPPTPTPALGGPGRYCSCNSNDKRTYASNITYTQMFDFKRNTPSRGYWEYVSWGLVDLIINFNHLFEFSSPLMRLSRFFVLFKFFKILHGILGFKLNFQNFLRNRFYAVFLRTPVFINQP